jgi:hypothetical protein
MRCLQARHGLGHPVQCVRIELLKCVCACRIVCVCVDDVVDGILQLCESGLVNLQREGATSLAFIAEVMVLSE